MINMHVTFYEFSGEGCFIKGTTAIGIRFGAGKTLRYLTHFYTLEEICLNGSFKNNLHAVQSLAGYMSMHKKIKLISLEYERV